MTEQKPSGSEPCFSSHLVRPFLKVLEGHPSIPPQLLESLLNQDPDTRVPVHACDELLQGAIVLTGDPGLALRAARAADTGNYEVLEYTAMSAGTVRECLECMVRYMRLVNDIARFQLEVVDGKAVLDLETSEKMSRASVEFKLAAIYAQARRWIDREAGDVELWFTHPEPEHVATYREVFGRHKLRFNAPKDAIVFGADHLDTPIKGADRLLHHVLRRHADQLLQELPKSDSLSERVRRHILETMPDGSVSADKVASLLSMSRRTLTRHLAEESTTFRDLLEDTRKRMAQQYLTTTNMSASDVAFLLGFSEAAPFVRAFKRWTRQTPTEYRRSHQR